MNDVVYTEKTVASMDAFSDVEAYLLDLPNQLDGGSFTAHCRELRLQGITLTYFQSQQSLAFRSTVPPNTKVIAFSARSEDSRAIWSGADIEPNTLCIFRPGTDHLFRLPPNWSDYQILVDDAFLPAHILRALTAITTPEKGRFPMTPDDGDRLRARLAAVMDLAASFNGIINTADLAAMLSNLLLELVQNIHETVIPRGAIPLDRQQYRQSQLVERSIELVNSADSTLNTAAELQETVGANKWKLQRSFKQLLGLSPLSVHAAYAIKSGTLGYL